jgi:hypothetical protein
MRSSKTIEETVIKPVKFTLQADMKAASGVEG